HSPTSTLLPYTTLFRSLIVAHVATKRSRRHQFREEVKIQGPCALTAEHLRLGDVQRGSHGPACVSSRRSPASRARVSHRSRGDRSEEHTSELQSRENLV